MRRGRRAELGDDSKQFAKSLRCGICSTAIPGLFEVRPGQLGAAARSDRDRRQRHLNEDDAGAEAPQGLRVGVGL